MHCSLVTFILHSIFRDVGFIMWNINIKGVLYLLYTASAFLTYFDVFIEQKLKQRRYVANI